MEAGRAFPIRTGSSSFQSNVASGHARVHMGDVYNVNYSGAAPVSTCEQILDSLWFEKIEAREDSIRGATPGTLDWIYDSNIEGSDSQNPHSEDHYGQDQVIDDQIDSNWDHNNRDEPGQYRESHRAQDWDSLATWLEEGDSIYWVCGKAGSGKSTLMAHIVDDYRTRECLSKWAQDKPFHVLKFFFWRPGSELQKSVNGLLRTILYQICMEVDQVVQKIAKAVRWQPVRQASWTDKRLTLAIKTALTSSEDVFCFFLDGLDEFVGDLSTLTELVYQLEALENVKLCVSSRPEAELTANFSSCKQLRLERLNQVDIEQFVRRQLHRFNHKPMFTALQQETYSRFVSDVVYHAHGVFLWAVLVLPTLVKGISSGDDWHMLQTRLNTTPKAINDLYTSMLAKLDPLHRESFFFYIELMRLVGNDGFGSATVAQITAAQIGEALLNMPYEDFLQACELERVRIVGRGVGLLQISEQRGVHDKVDLGQCVAIPQLIADDGMSSAHIRSARDAAKLRTVMPGSVSNAEAHIRANKDYLDWIHRSAHDFIFPPDGSLSPVFKLHSGRPDACGMLLSGTLRLLAVSPSFDFESPTSGSGLLTSIIITDRIMETKSEIALEIAQEMPLIVRDMRREDFQFCLLPYAREELGSSLNAFFFWINCLEINAWFIIRALVSVLLSEPAGNALFMPLYRNISSWLWDHKATVRSNLESVIMPFLEKIEQNIWSPGEASARVVLYFHGEENVEGCDYRRMRHLSCTVPDSLGPKQPAAVQKFLEEYSSGWAVEYPEVVVAYFDRVAASIHLFSDLEIQPPKSYPHETQHFRMLLQASCQLKRWLCFGAVALNHNPDYCDEFRVVCLPAGFWVCGDDAYEPDNEEYGERTEFIYFAPSSRTCICLLQAIRQAVTERNLSDADVLYQCTQMLVEDIWENSHGLDATQQLFALACVKWTIPRWLHWIMDVRKYR